MSDHAKQFRALHQGPTPLILANAWDAGSARLIVRLGKKHPDLTVEVLAHEGLVEIGGASVEHFPLGSFR